MNKKYNVFKIIYFTIVGIIVFGYKDLSSVANNLEYVSCGTADKIPKPIPQLTSVAYTLLVTATPLILIIFSVIVLFKAVSTGSADDVEKAKKNLFKKFIVAAVIFFVGAIVQFVLLKVTTNKDDSKSVTACLKCFMYYSSSNCPSYSDEGDYEGRKKTRQTSNYTNSNVVRNSNKSRNNSSSSTANKVLLVGDSRTAQICGYTDGQMHSGEKCRDYVAVAKGGMGATWFRDDAIPAIDKVLSENTNDKYKIIILMGANDVGENPGDESNSLSIYQSKLSELAKGQWKNHTIVFVKTTSADQTMANSNGMHISQSQINTFNTKMKEYINSQKISNLSYCEIDDVPTSYLSDGVHYNQDGSNFYYEQVKNKCA